MTQPKLTKLFSNFADAFKEHADPDFRVTHARIAPILGGVFTHSVLDLVSKFVTELFYEPIDLSMESYVVIRGIRFPLSQFDALRKLDDWSSEDLQSLATSLAASGHGELFPSSYVDLNAFFGDGRSDIYTCVERQFDPMVEEARLALQDPTFHSVSAVKGGGAVLTDLLPKDGR